MSTFTGPTQISNLLKPKIWGRRDLAPLYQITPAPGAEPPLIGEVWITDDAAVFQNGPASGMTLAAASEKFGSDLLGKSWKGGRFPLLAKYIFTSDWLSVQVHPDDDYAAAHDPGNLGKCEMWYFLKTDAEASILLGLKTGVTKQQLRQEFKSGTSRGSLQSHRPQPEEAAFLPPGIVHALGPGLVLFEVEENSDLTYRLDDFGRLGLDGKPRPLHVEKGLEVFRPELKPQRDLPRLEFREKYGSRRFVLACRHFALEELRLVHLGHFVASKERVEVLSILEGEGRIENHLGWLGYRQGETWLIPPGIDRYRIVPFENTKVLKFYVPDLNRDFREPLKRHKVPAEQIRQIVFE